VPAGSVVGSGASVSWEAPAGTFGSQNVTIEVIDDRGCRDTTSATVDLYEPPVADLVAPARMCSDRDAGFSFPVDASGSTPGRGTIPGTGYSWTTTLGSLGGSSSSTETVTLAANASGSADVCVRVDDSLTCSDSICETVMIDP